MSYLYLNLTRDTIEGDRDALVTLRSAINEALRNREATVEATDRDGDDAVFLVKLHGE